MKNALKLVAVLVMLCSYTTNVMAEQGLDYKKFGKIATAVVTEDYPSDQVVDYKYIGRKEVRPGFVLDSFRFKVMVNNKERFVTVSITHDNKAGKELTIKVVEE